MKTENFHIGTIIRAELGRQGHTVAWLSRQLNIQRPNCYRILRAGSLQSDLLLRISVVMKHNFFSYYTIEYTEKIK